MWLVPLVALAVLNLALGIAGIGVSLAGADLSRLLSNRDFHRLVVIVVYAALSMYLMLGAQRDVRAAYLGAALLMVSVFFAHTPILTLAAALPPGARRTVSIVRALPVETFTPAIAWLFVRDFPRAFEQRRVTLLVNAAIAISFAIAVLVVLANLGIELFEDASSLQGLDRKDLFSGYQTVVWGMLLLVLPLMFWRARRAPIDERRRVTLFGGGFIFALPSVLFALLPSLSPQLAEFAVGEFAQSVIVPVLILCVLAMAATTTYAVVVQQVIDVRTFLRKAAQYAIARVVVALLAGIPFALIAGVLYGARGEPVASLFTGVRPLQILFLAGVGAAVLRLRQRVMLSVDRIFFREPYDTREVLSAVTRGARDASSGEDLAEVVCGELSRALHLESIGMLATPGAGEDYTPLRGSSRTLPASSQLAALVESHAAPLSVELDRPSDVGALPLSDRQWIADAAIQLLVPLTSAEGGPRGLLALGAKRSELPFSREDRLLLEAIADATGIALESRLRPRLDEPGAAAPSPANASECADCGLVADADATACTTCSGALQAAPLPRRVFGKFELERRVGRGSMGVVYRASDLSLGRPVALKTLPAARPEDAGRLRREARAMAAITHPHLALIHGVESWMGTPVLVIEFLGGGTLSERIERSPLPIGEALELAREMARVLERAHASGILHRDIKPSNIGYTDTGEAKLLDFGLVRIAGTAASLGASFSPGRATETGLAGTPLYMSPEALDAQRPGPDFDLWGLAVVAYEAATGVHPFERDTWAGTLTAIREGWTDALRTRLDARVREQAAPVFARALARDRSRRQASAAELASELGQLIARSA